MLDNIRFVYFIGIGGIGMSALARWCRINGYQVAGYDRTATPLTDALQSEGIPIHFEDNIHLIPADFLASPKKTLVVYTPAIPKEHQELQYLQAAGFNCQKRAAVLGWIANQMRCLAIAGTHGKTSTSATLAHLLHYNQEDCAAFLGGIAQNYQTNFLPNRGTPACAWAVVEADEYDRSFLHLLPRAAVITSTDADHLDIYGQSEHLLKSYAEFGNKVCQGGWLFLHHSTQLSKNDFEGRNTWRYAVHQEKEVDVWAENIRLQKNAILFDWMVQGRALLKEVILPVPGLHSLSNALAAITIAWKVVQVSPEKLKEALATYKGVKRRFEIVLESDWLVYVDDYAHHPTEIEAFIAAMRLRYPRRHLTVIFQPHLFSRTRDFAEGFAKSLSQADRLILLPIYPAREKPIDGVDSELIFRHVSLKDKYLVSEVELLPLLEQLPIDLLATVGAGDIDRFVPQIANMFTCKIP
ncbi:MAG: UDP-N-acetylmuramate--L-alanine ligase [Cytophagales bacterium]|nr:UDP-N-acetylmuramate--L-alanine ligase [Bernardetiaceae bacterium]MDW8211676.1 UDP-N-acetylmuramate--L-alanine ligase [Cytophagales bacterium]